MEEADKVAWQAYDERKRRQAVPRKKGAKPKEAYNPHLVTITEVTYTAPF